MMAPMPAIDVRRARAATPGCDNVVHFNNAGAALMPRPVLDAVRGHLDREAAIGGYEAAAEAAGRLDAVYDELAALIGARRGEIAVVENATRAWDMAFYGFAFEPRDRILTARAEYVSNYVAFLQVAARTGATIEVIPDDEDGAFDVEALRAALDERVRLIAVTHVPTNGGLVNPAAAIGAVAREAGVPFLLDACQSVGQLPLDVEAIGCDVLSATGRKFLRGPRGTGFLYVRGELLERLEPPFVDLHAAPWVERDRYQLRPDARRFENWEGYVAGKLGLGAAAAYAREWGMEAVQERVKGLAEELRAQLSTVGGAMVHDRGRERCGIVSFTVDGASSEEVRSALAARAINVSVSPRGQTRIDMEGRGLPDLVRASVHYYNTEDEVSRVAGAVSRLAAAVRGAR
jgi:selenocysteine lyase/cysteine desulfurase